MDDDAVDLAAAMSARSCCKPVGRCCRGEAAVVVALGEADPARVAWLAMKASADSRWASRN